MKILSHLTFSVGQIAAYSTVFNNVQNSAENTLALNEPKAIETLNAISLASSELSTLRNFLQGLTVDQTNKCIDEVSDESDIYINFDNDGADFFDVYEDLLFSFGFNYIGTKYHSSGNLINNIHSGIESCVNFISPLDLSTIRDELDNSLRIVSSSKSYADIKFGLFTDEENAYCGPVLGFTDQQRDRFETGYQLRLFNRVYEDTWENARQVTTTGLLGETFLRFSHFANTKFCIFVFFIFHRKVYFLTNLLHSRSRYFRISNLIPNPSRPLGQ